MPFGKILRTIVSEVEIEEIAILPAIGQTSGQSLMTVIDAIQNIVVMLIGIDRFVLCVFQYAAQHMVTECAVVVQLGF